MNDRDAIDEAASRAVSTASFTKVIEEAIAKAVTKFEPESLARKVEAKIDQAWEQMALKMLGFDNRWGTKWEIDHCNGRHSSMSNMLVTKTHAAVDDFLKRAGAALGNLEITPELIKSMKHEYDSSFKNALNRAVINKAEHAAQDFVDKKMSKVLDHYIEPEAEAIHALHQAIKTVKDPKVVEMLKNSLKELEGYTLKALDD